MADAHLTSTGRVSLHGKFLGPTNTKGSRIRVRRADHRPGDLVVIMGWDYALNAEENAIHAFGLWLKHHLDEGHDSWAGDWVVGTGQDEWFAVRVPPTLKEQPSTPTTT